MEKWPQLRHPKKVIIKIQLSISTNVNPETDEVDGGFHYVDSHFLAYDKSQQFMYEDLTTTDIKKIMKGRQKAFFYCWLVPNKEGDWLMDIKEEAPWQDW
jgi:hypothetical protein